MLTSASYADRQDCRIGLINIEYNCVVVWCRTLGQVSRLQSYIKPALSDNGWCDMRPLCNTVWGNIPVIGVYSKYGPGSVVGNEGGSILILPPHWRSSYIVTLFIFCYSLSAAAPSPELLVILISWPHYRPDIFHHHCCCQYPRPGEFNNCDIDIE